MPRRSSSIAASRAPNASGSFSAVAARSSLTARWAIESRTSQPAAGVGVVHCVSSMPCDDRVEVGLLGREIAEQARVVDHAGNVHSRERRFTRLVVGGTRMLDREFVLPHLLAKLARDDPDAIAMQDVDGHSETAPRAARDQPSLGRRLPAARHRSGRARRDDAPELVRRVPRLARTVLAGRDRGAHQHDVPRRHAALPGHRLRSAHHHHQRALPRRARRRRGRAAEPRDGRRPRRDRRAARASAARRPRRRVLRRRADRPTTSTAPTTGTSPRSSTHRAPPGRRRACSCRGARCGRS